MRQLQSMADLSQPTSRPDSHFGAMSGRQSVLTPKTAPKVQSQLCRSWHDRAGTIRLRGGEIWRIAFWATYRPRNCYSFLGGHADKVSPNLGDGCQYDDNMHPDRSERSRANLTLSSLMPPFLRSIGDRPLLCNLLRVLTYATVGRRATVRSHELEAASQQCPAK